MAGARIKVERKHDHVGVFRSYRVVLDGTTVARVKHGKSARIDVAAGHHELHLAIDWTRSPPVELDLREGEEALVRCWARANPFTVLFWSTFQPRRCIGVELIKGRSGEPRT
jgi:hypothetical protein